MRKLQWNKIPINKVIGKKNVWTAVGKMFNGYKLDFDQMEELFSTAPSKPKEISPDGSAPSEKKKKSEEVNLLDGKRSLNVNIYLRQFRMPHNEIVESLGKGESEKVGAEKLRGLLKILPESDETELLRSYQGDKAKLGNAEKFFIELVALPNYKLRIESMLVKEEFNQTLDYIKPSIDAIILTARDLKESKSLHEIIYMVLIAGNFLNAGGYAGDAAGFKLGSLLKLTEIRANKPRMNLMHYVVMQAAYKHPELLELPSEFKYLKEASQYSVESLTSDIKALTDKIKSISEQILKTDEDFQQQMGSFLKMAQSEMGELELDLKELDELRIELANYFCEDDKSFKLEECIKTFNTFCQKFTKAIDENKERRDQEERAEQRKKQREEQISVKKRQPSGESKSTEGSRPTSAVSDDGESNIVDKLLGDIRGGFANKSGDIAPKSKDVRLENGTVVTAFSAGSGSGTDNSSELAPDTAFARSGSLRNSGRKNSLAQRLRSIDESKGDKDGKGTDELFDLLLQSGDADPAAFDRQGSLRRRRRTRPTLDALVMDRERAPSPNNPPSAEIVPSPLEKPVERESALPERRWRSSSVATMEKTELPAFQFDRRASSRNLDPPAIEVTPSVLSVTDRISKSEHLPANEPVVIPSKVEVPIPQPVEDEATIKEFEEKKSEMNKRRLERRRRSAMGLQSLLESRKNGGVPVSQSVSSPIKECPTSDSVFAFDDGPELSAREKLLNRYQSRFTRRYSSADPTDVSSVISNGSSVNGDNYGAEEQSEPELSDKFARRRQQNSGRRWSTFEKTLGNLDVDQVIRDVEKTGEEIQRLGKTSDAVGTSRYNRPWANGDLDSVFTNGTGKETYGQDELNSSNQTTPTITPTDSAATTPRLRRWGSTLDKSEPELPREPSPVTSSRRQTAYTSIGDVKPEAGSTITERALLEHTKGRWKSNVDQEDVDEAIKKIAADAQSRIRPYSTYDNVLDTKAVSDKLSNENNGDVSPITKRWGRVFAEEDNKESEAESALKRSATLPKRWKTGQWRKDILGETNKEIIEEEAKPESLETSATVADDDGYFNLDRNNKFRQSLRLTGLKKDKTADAPITTSTWRKDAETQQLNSAVQEFQNKIPVTQRVARKERFKALSRLYSDDHVEDTTIPSKTYANGENPLGKLYENNVDADIVDARFSNHDQTTLSPRNSRFEDVKSDNESVASGKDEGFESESISDPSVSQRTSMSSTLDSDITLTPTLKRKEYQKSQLDEPEESRTNYFARSIDSLVLRPELTISDSTADIDIDGHTNKGPSDEGWTTTEYTTETSINDLPAEVQKAIFSKATPASASPISSASPASSSRGTPKKAEMTKAELKPSPKTVTPRQTSATTTPKTPRSALTKKTTPSSAKSIPSKSPTKTLSSSTAASVTDRLSRPKRPTGLSRHASNSSVNSDNSSISTLSTPRGAGKTTPKSRISSAGTSRTSARDNLTSPSSSFVRGGAGRATMPAAVLRTNKKAAAEKEEAKGAPTPPRRTTSISQSVTDRLTAGISPRSKDAASPGSKTPTTPKRSTSFSVKEKDSKVKSFMSRLSTGKAKGEEGAASARASPRATSKVSPAPSRPGRATELSLTGKPASPSPRTPRRSTAADDKPSSFMKKIIDKSSPKAKGVGIKTTTKSSRC